MCTKCAVVLRETVCVETEHVGDCVGDCVCGRPYVETCPRAWHGPFLFPSVLDKIAGSGPLLRRFPAGDRDPPVFHH